MLGRNFDPLSLDQIGYVGPQVGTDNDLARPRALAISRCKVRRVANDRVLHQLFRSDEPVAYFTAMKSDPNLAGLQLPPNTILIYTFHDFLHRHRGAYRVLIFLALRSARIRARETDSEHGND